METETFKLNFRKLFLVPQNNNHDSRMKKIFD